MPLHSTAVPLARLWQMPRPRVGVFFKVDSETNPTKPLYSYPLTEKGLGPLKIGSFAYQVEALIQVGSSNNQVGFETAPCAETLSWLPTQSAGRPIQIGLLFIDSKVSRCDSIFAISFPAPPPVSYPGDRLRTHCDSSHFSP